MFAPLRALGCVTEGRVRPAVHTLGRRTFITTAAGGAFQVYDASHARLVMVGPSAPLEDAVTALAALGGSREVTCAAAGGDVHVCARAHRVAVLRSPRPVARARAGAGRAAVLDLLVPLLATAHRCKKSHRYSAHPYPHHLTAL